MRNLTIIIIAFSCFILLASVNALAFEDQESFDLLPENSFILSPTKIEILLDPGESTIKDLLIVNRLGRAGNFKVEIEDCQGSSIGEQPVVLLGEKRGPYPLKDYLKPQFTGFTLQHEESVVLPIEVSVPEGMEPGGLYGAVLVGGSFAQDVEKGNVQMIGRVGTLFFVKVKGEVEESGALEGFTTADSKRIYQKGPVALSIMYRNTGNVHLAPSGMIEVKNIFGKKIDTIEIEPYFSMPASLRRKEVAWKREKGFGRYTASLVLNRGYKDKEDVVDKAEISFWILPQQMVVIMGVVLFFFIILIVLFRLKRRTRKFPLKYSKND